MTRTRTDAQVLTSARQMDVCLADGIRAEVLVELVMAREAWHATGVMPPLTSWARAALRTAAVGEWDAIFTLAARHASGDL